MSLLSPRFSCPAGCGFLAVKWSVMEMHLMAQNESCRWIMHCLPTRARDFAETQVKKPKASVTALEDFVIWKVPTTHRSPASMIVWSFEECRMGDVELVLSFDFACCLPGPVASCKKGAGYLMEYRTGLCDPNSSEIVFSPWRAEILNTLVFLHERVNNEVRLSKTSQDNFVDPTWVCLETRPGLSRRVGDTVIVDDITRVATWTVVQSECGLLVSEAFTIGDIKGCFERQLPGTVRVHVGRPSSLKSLSVDLHKEGEESKIQVFTPDDEQKFITIEIDVGESPVKTADRFMLRVIDVQIHNERKASARDLVVQPESSTPRPLQAHGSNNTTSTLASVRIATPSNDVVQFDEDTCARDDVLCTREKTLLVESTEEEEGEERDDTKGGAAAEEDNEVVKATDDIGEQMPTVDRMVNNDVNDENNIKAGSDDKDANNETRMDKSDCKANGEKVFDAESEDISKYQTAKDGKLKHEEINSTCDDSVNSEKDARIKQTTTCDISLIAVESDARGTSDAKDNVKVSRAGAGDGASTSLTRASIVDKPKEDKCNVQSQSPASLGAPRTTDKDASDVPATLLHTPPPGFTSPADTTTPPFVMTYAKVVSQRAPNSSIGRPPFTKASPKALQPPDNARQAPVQPVPCKAGRPADGIPLSKEVKVAGNAHHAPDKGGAGKHSTLLDSFATSRSGKALVVGRPNKAQWRPEKEEHDSENGKKVKTENALISSTPAPLRKTDRSTASRNSPTKANSWVGGAGSNEKCGSNERICDTSERENPGKENMSRMSAEGNSYASFNVKGGRVKNDSSWSWKTDWEWQNGKWASSNANELKEEEQKAGEQKAEEKKVDEKHADEKVDEKKTEEQKLRNQIIQWVKNNDIQKWQDSPHAVRWRIVLKSRQLNDAMLKAVASYIKDCISHNTNPRHYFESLDFADNCITDAGVDSLIDVLDLPKVTWNRLSLYHNALTDKSALRLSATLKVITTPPTELHLSDCMITDVGFLALVDALKTNSVFPRLDARKWPVPVWAQLRNNYISLACIKKCNDQGLICASSNRINCYIHYCRLAKKNAGTTPLLHVKNIYDQKPYDNKSGKRSSGW